MIVYDKPSWLRTVFMLRGSTLLSTWPRLLLVTFVAALVTYLHESYDLLSSNLTTTPFSLIGLALGIFLGFRNNTSYDRFWEGRKLWGRVVNTSRTLTRQILTLVGTHDGKAHPAPTAEQRALVFRIIAYVHALRLHLRDQDRLEEVSPFLPKGVGGELRDVLNRPIAILQGLGIELRGDYDRGAVHSQHLVLLEESLRELTDVQGGCERIKSTPIPFSYNILLHRIVGVYCFTLPFGLVDVIGVLTPAVVLLVSYAFFGLDAVGDQIEDPFGEDANDLPLHSITTMIEVNLKQALGDTDVPELDRPIDGMLT